MEKFNRHLWFWVLAQACLVLAVAGWRIHRGPLPYSPAISVRMDMQGELKIPLLEFYVDCGRYPTTAEGLEALLRCPTNIPAGKWHGPYFDPATIPQDPWKHDYVYRYPGIHNTNGFDIYSCGPGGISKSGGDDPDDINNWDSHSPHGGYFLDASAGDPVFFATASALMVIPFFCGLVMISALFSKQIRCLIASNQTPYLVWYLISLAVVVMFVTSLPPVAGK